MQSYKLFVGARGLVGASLLLAFVASSTAQDANGLWANQPDACDTIFVKKGGRTEFAPTSDFYGSGFIIEGDVIRGKTATCKVIRKAREGDIVTITATCASDVVVTDATFQLKVDSADTFVRIVPGIPELNTNYIRCPPK